MNREANVRARRALLYMPGDDMHKIQKAAGLDVDSVCMDLEDGVAANRKDAAREAILEALRTVDFGRSERLVRINPVGSGLEMQDLQIILAGRPDGVVIPKVESPEQVRWASAQIAAFEGENSWPEGAICLIAIVESARAIVNLAQIASADERLEVLVFGAEDLAGDIGIVRTQAGWEVFYARSAVVTFAAAFDLQAIDMVYVNFKDVEGLKKEALQGAQMGFAGKQIIHPAQVTPVQEAFTPDEEAIASARRITQAFREHQQAGLGAFALDGKMIDAPLVKAAERVLARARAAGKI
jgi:citrate lyase beta subunit